MNQCRICRGEDFKEVINMGFQPLVNSLIEKEDLNAIERTYPLVIEQCQDCGLVQIVNPLDTHSIYTRQDYLYYSGDMPGLEDYFQEYVNDLKYRFIDKSSDFVVEIGSNDGLFLGLFRETQEVLGVDPSVNVGIRALKNGIPTITAGFSKKVATNIRKEFGKAKLIIGNNCIAHIDDLHGVLDGVQELLDNDGVFVVECNYWGAMVKNKNYSLIYHDHFSYFTIMDWITASSRHGLVVFDAIITPSQGGSLRIFMQKGTKYDRTPNFDELAQEEANNNLIDYSTCLKYNRECRKEANKLGDEVRTLKAEGNIIAGYGAAAKGFSIIALAGLTEKEIDFFVDDSPAKQGKYTPITHIPIVKRKDRPDPDVFIITAPNYAKIIMEKEENFKGIWITP